MLKLFLVLALLGVAVHALPQLFDAHKFIAAEEVHDYGRFNEFVEKFEKSYQGLTEVLHRFRVYRENLKSAAELQARDAGTARFGETKFSDMTREEFRRQYTSRRLKKNDIEGDPCDATIYNHTVAAAYDWRQQSGVVARVKNQGACGSCWAFSVVGNIEGQLKLHHNKTIELSEQNLVDCDKIDYGCSGGLPLDAYKEIQRFGGLESEKDYPYHAHDQQCQMDKTKVVVKVTGSCQVEQCEEAMKTFLHENGPLSIGLNADYLMSYQSGIIRPKHSYDCDPEALDHGIVLVGYGQKDKLPFWIVKNSWGPNWGEEGYFRLYRGENVCGVREMVTTAYIE